MRKYFIFMLLVMLILGIAIGCGSADVPENGEVPDPVEEPELFPTKPVRIIVPFGPGGGGDILSRAVSAYIPQYLGQPIIVENLPGGATVPAQEYVINSDPDGYTLIFMGEQQTAITPVWMGDWEFDPLEEFIAIARFVSTNNFLFVPTDSPFNSLDELIEYAKENPGGVSIGHSGAGGVHHLTIVQLERVAGVEIADVTYDGSGASAIAAAGGHIDGHISALAANIPLYEAGKLRPLVSFKYTDDPAERHPDFNVPTALELGYDVRGIQLWGFGAPKGTPDTIIKILEDAFRAVFEDTGFVSLAGRLSLDLHFDGSAVYQQELLDFRDVIRELVKE